MKKRILSLLTAAAMILSLAACNTDGVPEETTAETTAEEPQPYPLYINDVEITHSPEKIVCLSPFVAEILNEIGCGGKIIARSSYCDFPPSILDAEDLGSSASPDIDRIIGLAPDVVIASTPLASKDVFRMEQANIKTIVIAAPTTIEEFSSVYTAVGLLTEGLFTGKERGESGFSGVSQTLSNTANVKIGKFLYITENMDVATGDTFESAVLSCFGINLAAGFSDYTVDKSLFLGNQPDVILLNDKYTLEELQSDEYLSQLDAVINGEVIFISNAYFERPSARLSEMIKNLLDDYKKLTLDAS